MPGHDDEFADEGTEIDVDALVLIVVGAHPKAEMFDRTIAYRLRQRMIGWLDQRFPTGGPRPLLPLVCSDVWYLNDQSLRERPAVAVGGPGVNALSAYLADKLPISRWTMCSWCRWIWSSTRTSRAAGGSRRPTPPRR